MRKDRIKELAAHLKKCEWSSAGPGKAEDNSHFRLARWQFDCGAPGCIAGHAVALFGNLQRLPSDEAGPSIFRQAKELLDLTAFEANRLFIPDDTHSSGGVSFRLFEDRGLSDIAPKEAAKVLEYLAETGAVEWDILEPGFKG